jgi:GntR family transcriptional regulator, transcriptional repressor for pyruvate dehydrogenase complex
MALTTDLLQPIPPPPSLKDELVRRFEGLILAGQLAPGERLPSERELAAQLNVGRPAIHEALMELAARGLLVQRPRRGTEVVDYRREGSLALLQSLFGGADAPVAPDILMGLLEARRLFEREAARLAARRCDAEAVAELEGGVAAAAALDAEDVAALLGADYRLHHGIALASGNPIFAMALASLKPAHTALAGRFYRTPGVLEIVRPLQAALVAAIAAGQEDEAERLMTRLLEHGAQVVSSDPGRET